MNRDYDHMFKIVLVGDSNVGKSCTLIRFADDSFIENYITTIGVDFRFKTLDLGEKTVKLQIWDTAGQERYRTITNAYYRGSDGIFLTVDATNRKTFENVPSWLKEIGKYTDESVKKVLLVNKTDLEDKREVLDEDLEAFKKEWDIPYFLTSAKTGANVDKAFLNITEQLLNRAPPEEADPLTVQRRKFGGEAQSLFKPDKMKSDFSCCGG